METKNNTPFVVVALPLDGVEDKPTLAVIVKATFGISPDGKLDPGVEQMPINWGDAMYEDPEKGVKFEADIVVFKPRADIVVVGSAHAPTGKMVYYVDVYLRVGQTFKYLRVFGDRKWEYPGRLSSQRITQPEPFSSMLLTYDIAFGGIDKVGGGWCPENPGGTGFISKNTRKAIHDVVLPNIEDPRFPIKKSTDHPDPVGCAFFSRGAKPRIDFLGTFDEKWRTERSPKMPEDFKFDYNNGAHPDLQVEGYLQGNEEVELVGLSPEGPMKFCLPGIFIDCLVTPVDQDGQKAVEGKLPLNLDTLCIIPDEKRLYMVWRGNVPVVDDLASNIASITVKHLG